MPNGYSLPGAGSTGLSSHRPRDSEIRQECASAGLLEQHVLRLYIAMDHASPAGCLERSGEIRDYAGGFLDGERPVPQQLLSQALAGHFIHDVVEQPAGASCRVHRHNVRVPQARDRPRLGQEAARDRLVCGELGVNHLDRHWPVQGGIRGQKDHAHSTASELSLEPVLRSKRGLQALEEVDGRIAHVRDRWGRLKNTPALRLGHTIGEGTIPITGIGCSRAREGCRVRPACARFFT